MAANVGLYIFSANSITFQSKKMNNRSVCKLKVTSYCNFLSLSIFLFLDTMTTTKKTIDTRRMIATGTANAIANNIITSNIIDTSCSGFVTPSGNKDTNTVVIASYPGPTTPDFQVG